MSNEFDVFEMEEQCNEDNSDNDLGSRLHDEAYSNGFSTLLARATAPNTAGKSHLDQLGNVVESPSHLRPAKIIEDILSRDDLAKTIQDILERDNPARKIQDILDRANAAKLIEKLASKDDLRKLLEDALSDNRPFAQIEGRQHEPVRKLEELIRRIAGNLGLRFETPKPEIPGAPDRDSRPDQEPYFPGRFAEAVPLAKKG